jgi:hypothetical protein
MDMYIRVYDNINFNIPNRGTSHVQNITEYLVQEKDCILSMASEAAKGGSEHSSYNNESILCC